MSRIINTVTGPITADQLGRTVMHDHLCFGYPGFEFDASTGKCIEKEEAINKCVHDAKILVAQGIKTLVDPTPMDCGRNAEWLKEISEKSGLQIICVTGMFGEGFSATGYWNLRMHCGDAASEYAELLEAELTKGIGNTGIKAGIIKIATGRNQISDYQKTFIKGAAMAHKATGATIYTHTEDGELGFDQAKLFLKFGCDASKIVIGHMCGEIRTSVHKDILDWGFNVGFDRIGAYDSYHPEDREKAMTMARLIKAGYGDQIVVSQDAICQRLGRPLVWPEEELFEWRHYKFGYLCDTFLPLLKNEYGVTEQEIDKLLIDNPKRILG